MNLRDFDCLTRGPFDLLVIGGGIYGAWTAFDASLRGLKVALVEKGDWASGTSSASSKLIHGGLRYLEHLRFGLVRKSLRERSLLLALAPHRVLPSRFVIPLSEGGRVGNVRLRGGLRLYDILAGSGNPMEGHSTLNREETLSRYPFLGEEGLQGSAAYGDCITDDARFTLEVVEGARRAGAEVVNYAEAVEVLLRGDRAAGAAVRDRLGGSTCEVEARLVVNTSGPWAAQVALDSGFSRSLRLTKGVHLVFPGLPAPDAFLFLTRSDKRVLFFIPWYGKTLVGTTDSDYIGYPDDVHVDDEDVAYLLEEAAHVLRPGTWSPSDISGSSAGLRALRHAPGIPPEALTREWSLLKCPFGMLTSLGGKLTSARADAAEIVDEAMRLLGRSWRGRAPTETRPLPFSPAGDFPIWRQGVLREALRLGIDSETALCSARRYGTAVEKIFDLIRRDPSLAERLSPRLPFSRAEAVQGASLEMVARLEDLLRRRIPLLLLEPPERTLVEESASLAATVLGWNAERCREEVDLVMTGPHPSPLPPHQRPIPVDRNKRPR